MGSGMTLPSLTLWRHFHWFTPYLLAISLGAVSHATAAETYWQVQQSGITAIVEGDKDTAKRVADTALRLQSAARWLLSWPESYREPPAIIFEVNEDLLRRTFQFPAEPFRAYTDDTAGHELWVRTPALIVVAVSMEYRKGEELRSLQHGYGAALLRAEPSHDWPPCIHVGMSLLLTAAELSPPNHLFLSGKKVRDPAGHMWNPERFLVPTNPLIQRMPLWDLDEGAYSCYQMSFTIASVTPELRAAFARMLTAVGRGTPLSVATTSELHQTLPEFKAGRYEIYQDLRVDFPEEVPVTPEAVPISLEQLQGLLGNLCRKLRNCRK